MLALRSSVATVKPSLPGSMTSSTRRSNSLRSVSNMSERAFAVADYVNVIALGLKVEFQAARQVLFVFHQQDVVH